MSHQKSLIIFIIALTGIIGRDIFACSVPPAEQGVPYCELISRTNRIVLAEPQRAIQIEGENWKPTHLYKFKVIEVLKGPAIDTFELSGDEPYPIGKYDRSHNNKFFWQNAWGRSGNDTDCKIYPSFELGKRFLVFIDEPYHTKSFELIETLDDPWLQEVRRSISGYCKEIDPKHFKVKLSESENKFIETAEAFLANPGDSVAVDLLRKRIKDLLPSLNLEIIYNHSISRITESKDKRLLMAYTAGCALKQLSVGWRDTFTLEGIESVLEVYKKIKDSERFFDPGMESLLKIEKAGCLLYFEQASAAAYNGYRGDSYAVTCKKPRKWIKEIRRSCRLSNTPSGEVSTICEVKK